LGVVLPQGFPGPGKQENKNNNDNIIFYHPRGRRSMRIEIIMIKKTLPHNNDKKKIIFTPRAGEA